MTLKINSSTSNLKLASYISYGLLVLYSIACVVVTKQIADEGNIPDKRGIDDEPID